MEHNDLVGKTPRRHFIGSLLAGVAGVGALLLRPRSTMAQDEQQHQPSPAEMGPILYRRTEEAERYYRTLYR